jgi:hypothetical protein
MTTGEAAAPMSRKNYIVGMTVIAISFSSLDLSHGLTEYLFRSCAPPVN